MADFEKQVSLIEVDVKTIEAKKQVEDLTRSIIDQNNSVKNNTTQIKQLEKDLQKPCPNGAYFDSKLYDGKRGELRFLKLYTRI